METEADSKGYLHVTVGMRLLGRYTVRGTLGQGTYGTVVEAQDSVGGGIVAIKVYRGVSRYRRPAMQELAVMQALQQSSEPHLFAQLLGWFEEGPHICVVQPRYACSLFDYLRHRRFSPLRRDALLTLSYQLTAAIASMHDAGIIHTDIKPENVMLRTRDASGALVATLSLIDFGSAVFSHDEHPKLISTRHYRAPEVVLGVGWSAAADVWSLGTLLCELATGSCLFSTHDNVEHLAMIERFLGSPVPRTLILRCDSESMKYFDDQCVLRWPELAAERVEKGTGTVDAMRPVTEQITDPLLRDLIVRCLDYDPSTRIPASDALVHPFFASKTDLEADGLRVLLRRSPSAPAVPADSSAESSRSSARAAVYRWPHDHASATAPLHKSAADPPVVSTLTVPQRSSSSTAFSPSLSLSSSSTSVSLSSAVRLPPKRILDSAAHDDDSVFEIDNSVDLDAVSLQQLLAGFSKRRRVLHPDPQ